MSRFHNDDEKTGEIQEPFYCTLIQFVFSDIFNLWGEILGWLCWNLLDQNMQCMVMEWWLYHDKIYRIWCLKLWRSKHKAKSNQLWIELYFTTGFDWVKILSSNYSVWTCVLPLRPAFDIPIITVVFRTLYFKLLTTVGL